MRDAAATPTGLLAAILVIPAARELFAFGPLHADDLAVAMLAGPAALFLLDAAAELSAFDGR